MRTRLIDKDIQVYDSPVDRQVRTANHLLVRINLSTIDQFRYIKIQPKTIDLNTRLVGINTEFVGFVPKSLVLRSIVLG